MKNKKIAVVVSTGEHRGIFFGYLDDFVLPENKTICLTDARMCVYFSENVKGFVGLAASGPKEGCRITPSAPEIILDGVNSIMRCSEISIDAWEAGIWS